MIVVYLRQARVRRRDWASLQRHPRSSALLVGLLAGFLSGSVNVAVPPLVIYFGPFGLGAVPMTQILNPCFLVGKSLHALTFGISGQIGLVALAFGIRIRNWLEPESYQGLLRQALRDNAVILVLQFGWRHGPQILP
jgi:hypothetical protein